MGQIDPFLLRTELLILQPTPFCNIDCRYCYLPTRNDRRRMSADVLEAVFASILPSPLARGILTVVWHAGEPLTVPIPWYEHACAVAERYRPVGLTVQHNFQTNGTLVTARWAEFFARTGAKVGISIDGPARLHDGNRRTRRGEGSHASAMRGLGLLQAAGCMPHVISVLTSDSLADPDALYDFYCEAGIDDVSFNVEEIEAANTRSSLADPAAVERFARFFRRFLQRMAMEPGRLALRELRTAAALLHAGGLPDGANQESEPMRIISVDVSGNVATFSPELIGTHDARYGDYTFGNIVNQPLDAIVAGVLKSDLYRDIRRGVAACARQCEWYDYCRGGSPANKLFEQGTFEVAETMCCRHTRKTVLSVVLSEIEAQLDQAGLASVTA